MSPSQLAWLLHALARLSIEPSADFMQQWYTAMGAPGAAARLGTRGFATVVWALAKLGTAPEEAWLRRLLHGSCLEADMGAWTPQRLANTVSAFVKCVLQTDVACGVMSGCQVAMHSSWTKSRCMHDHGVLQTPGYQSGLVFSACLACEHSVTYFYMPPGD